MTTVIRLGDGDDAAEGTDGKDIMMGGDGNDTLYGEGGNDVMMGNDDNDKLYGEDGNDLLMGGNGNDYLEGGSGNDKLQGGADSDTLYGGAGDDLLEGGDGDDVLVDHFGADTLKGEGGSDRIFYNSAALMIDGGDGEDIVLLNFYEKSLILVDNQNLARVEGLKLFNANSEFFVSLSAADIIRISDTDTFTITKNTNQVEIKHADTGWIDGSGNDADAAITSGIVGQYTLGDAKLIIQEDEFSY